MDEEEEEEEKREVAAGLGLWVEEVGREEMAKVEVLRARERQEMGCQGGVG